MGQGALELALDEGEGIVNEGLADAVALGGDPVQGDLALGVGGLGEGDELGLAAIAAGVPGAVRAHIWSVRPAVAASTAAFPAR